MPQWWGRKDTIIIFTVHKCVHIWLSRNFSLYPWGPVLWPWASGIDRTLFVILMRQFLMIFVHLKINKSFFLDFSDYMLFNILRQSYTQDFPESITLVSYSGNFSVNICDVHSIMAASLEIYIYTYTKCLWSGRCHRWQYNFMLKIWNLFYNSRLSWNHIKFQFLLWLHLPSFTKHIICLGSKALSIFSKLSTTICVYNPSHWLKSPLLLLKLKCYRFLRKPRLISLWNSFLHLWGP